MKTTPNIEVCATLEYWYIHEHGVLHETSFYFIVINLQASSSEDFNAPMNSRHAFK